MSDFYEPSSEFLVMVVKGEASIIGSIFAEANLQKTIELSTDSDPKNRDWANYILGNYDCDSPAVRAALLSGASDEDERVRAEAIRGLARKYPDAALPYIHRAFASPPVKTNIFVAAALVADQSLVPSLSAFAAEPLNDGLDDLIAAALKACQTGVPDELYR